MTQLAGDHVRIFVGGYELTGDSNRIAIDDGFKSLDVTTFGDHVHNYMLGQRQMGIHHSGYLNPAVGGSHPVLNGAALEGIVSVFIGQNAAPVVGDPVLTLRSLQNKYTTMPEVGRVIPFAATFRSYSGSEDGWGTALAVGSSFNNSTTATAVNNGGATTRGGAVYLHLLSSAPVDRYSFVLEGSATGAFSGEEAFITTFTLDGAQQGSERIAVTGTLPQYVRWKATRTSGAANDTVNIAMVLVRF